MGFALLFPILAVVYQNWLLLSFCLVWFFVSRAIRSISHLREHPEDIVHLPLAAIIIVVIALPIKLWAFMTMNTHGWLTRVHHRIGGEAPTEISLGGSHAAVALIPIAAHAGGGGLESHMDQHSAAPARRKARTKSRRKAYK
jgi:N-acetylglucosaminyltransferase